MWIPSLPESIDAEKVTAESDNGVVTIHVAKKPNVKPKKVEVKPTSHDLQESSSRGLIMQMIKP